MLRPYFHFQLFLLWVIFTGVMAFFIWLSWQMGYLENIFINDPTKITYLISLFFIGGCLHCGLKAYFLSKQLQAIHEISTHNQNWVDDQSLPGKFIATMVNIVQTQNDADPNSKESTDKQLLAEIYSSEAHSQHEMGWFITSLLVKLGLLGTVIGFVFMLQPLSGLESFDINDVQAVLSKMTAGMGIALNTTLMGLITSMLLSLQYLLLDHGADDLVARTIHHTETNLYHTISSQSEQ